jgi:hypothetical protein
MICSGEADVRFRLAGVEADFLDARAATSPHADKAGMPDRRCLRAVEAAAPMPAQNPPQRANSPANVLVVEDSIIIALDTEENLKRLGRGLQVQDGKQQSPARWPRLPRARPISR